jgi:hypothetical protein
MPNQVTEIKPLSEFEIHHRAKQIAEGLQDVSFVEAITIIQKVLSNVLSHNCFVTAEQVLQSSFNAHLIKRGSKRGQTPKIENDPEVKDFIVNLIEEEPNITYKKMAQKCKDKFGKPRAPSKNTIYRYLHKQHEQFERVKRGTINV